MIKYTSKVKDEIFMILNSVKNKKEAVEIYNKIKKVADKYLESKIAIEMLGFIEQSQIVSQSSKNRELFVQREPFSKPALELVEIVKKMTSNLTKNGEKIDKNNSIYTFFKKLLSSF